MFVSETIPARDESRHRPSRLHQACKMLHFPVCQGCPQVSRHVPQRDLRPRWDNMGEQPATPRYENLCTTFSEEHSSGGGVREDMASNRFQTTPGDECHGCSGVSCKTLISVTSTTLSGRRTLDLIGYQNRNLAKSLYERCPRIENARNLRCTLRRVYSVWITSSKQQ